MTSKRTTKKKAPKDWQVMFSARTGDLLDQAYKWHYDQPSEIVLRDASETFMAQMQVIKARANWSGSGRTAKLLMKDLLSGVKYYIFLDSFVAAAFDTVIDRGIIDGVWGYEKRGSSQGVYLVTSINTSSDYKQLVLDL